MSEPKIILIEDDADLRHSLVDCMAMTGFSVSAADSALQFYRLVAEDAFNVAIIDIGLPDEDGLSLARFLRQHRPGTGIIMLTARGSVSDRVVGFDTGADVYLVKPVDYEELEAAIRSVLRRLNGARHPAAGLMADDSAARWIFHRDSLSLTAPDGSTMGLSNREARLLITLIDSGDDIVSRSRLLGDLDYPDTEAGHRSLSAVFVRLRAKVEHATGLSLPIQTIRGQGYLAHGLYEG